MSRSQVSQENTRFRVLRLLEDNPDLTQREIAEHLGISLGGVNYCLRALANKGHVKTQNFQNSRNKMGYAYLLTPKGIAEKTALTARFLKRKMQEYEALKAEIEALEAEVNELPDSRASLGKESRS
jgi:EPS-associated MarR family transcriptional regulator